MRCRYADGGFFLRARPLYHTSVGIMPNKRNVVLESLILAESLIKPSTSAVGLVGEPVAAADDVVSAHTASLEKYWTLHSARSCARSDAQHERAVGAGQRGGHAREVGGPGVGARGDERAHDGTRGRRRHRDVQRRRLRSGAGRERFLRFEEPLRG